MKLKHAILQVMNRDTLKAVVDELELDGVDRRNLQDMADHISRAHRASPEFLLEFLYEPQVKEICELMGITSAGRRKALVHKLLRCQNMTTGERTRAPSRAASPKIRTMARKESTNMSEDHTSNAGATEQPVRLPEPPPGMMRVNKTELVWPGKYHEDGTLKEAARVSLPFQVIETVNESRATREAKKGQTLSLFDTYKGKEGDTFEAGWRNKLIWGDNLLVMGSLLEKFAGKIDLIYIDPPFATGADFSFTAEIGNSGEEVVKEQSIIEEKAYRDTWGQGRSSYLAMMFDRLTLMNALLSPTGSLFVHCDTRVNASLRLMLDGIFGEDFFRNQISWLRSSSGKTTSTNLPRDTDTILWYCKSRTFKPNPAYKPLADATLKMYAYDDGDGRGKYRFYPMQKTASPGPETTYDYIDHEGKVWKCPAKGWRMKESKIRALENDGRLVKAGNTLQEKAYWNERENEGRLVNDFWGDIPNLQGNNTEILGYATQKPEALIERIATIATSEGMLVADFFCGSGTTLAVAEKLGRRWIGCDLGRWGIHVTRKRMLGVENCKPFEVLNLGKYERQYWQGVTFGDAKDKPLTERALYEYLAFILKLYGAQPVAGMAHLHGKKGKAMVHIGAVDAPVTISEIDTAVDECAKLKQSDLHVLGWEWEMGLYDLMVEAAKKKGVKLLLLIIPREVMEQQAAAKGDVRFFELAYLEAEIKKPKKLTAQVALKDFVIPNTELIPEEVRSKVKKWSDYIDYWSVDWDFQNDTFMQGWVAYRTRRERKLPLACDPHTYEKAGKYRILVKVIDIFGNDTSQAFDAEVK